MATSEVNVRVKALVLRIEEDYLKENLRNPDYYSLSLKKHNILTSAQFQELKNVADVNARTVQLMEIVSAHPRGYDVLSMLIRKNRPDNHVLSYLKRKVSETSLLLTTSSDLSLEQRERLKLFEFLEHSSSSAEVARDILQNKGWDVQLALKAAQDMGLGKTNGGMANGGGAIVCVGVDSSSSSNGYCMGDSGEEEFSSLGSSTISSSSPASSSSDLAFSNGGRQDSVGPLPEPVAVTASPPSPETNDVHPCFGIMPHPLLSNSTGGSPTRPSPHAAPGPFPSATPTREKQQLADVGAAKPLTQVGPTVQTKSVAKTRPSEIKPSETRPSETRPPGIKPLETRPSETRPSGIRPAETRPSEIKPSETRPSETRSSGTRHSETRPSEARPSETRSSGTRPSEIKPSETRPSETRPSGTRPAETRSSETSGSVQASTGITRPNTLPTGNKADLTVPAGTRAPKKDKTEIAELCGRNSSASSPTEADTPGYLLTQNGAKGGVRQSSPKHVNAVGWTTGTTRKPLGGEGVPTKTVAPETPDYWVCYHCHEANNSVQVMCGRCNMLLQYTHPSWEVDDGNESRNYICKECELAVRLPYKPCPPTLIQILKEKNLCNKCYRDTCTPRCRFSDSLFSLSMKPTLLNLRSMRDRDGKKFCIIDEVAPHWDSLAPQLDIPNIQINILRRDFATQCQRACENMFSMFVDMPGVTWKKLLDGLRNIDELVLAHRIELAYGVALSQDKE